jgi:putative transposase
MDESHLGSAVSYVSLNPVRARLVSRAEGWAWSSVRAHLAGEDDSLVSVRPVRQYGDSLPIAANSAARGRESLSSSAYERREIGMPSPDEPSSQEPPSVM